MAESQSEGSVGYGLGSLPLEDPKATLKAFYAGAQMESPLGGVLVILGVQPLDDGSATLVMECNSSSLRYHLTIKKATRTERAKVKQFIEAGDDPWCPRHGDRQRLARAGARFVCSACGISFAKAV